MNSQPSKLNVDDIQLEASLKPSIENVLPFYLQKARSGQRVCLVTLFNVDSDSPRPVGSQIAVAEDGESFGFITGGCAESAIVHEALMALRENQSRTIRIGSDSPWFDIKLPCGAGIDLHFSVADSQEVIETACRQLEMRQAVSLLIDVEKDDVRVCDKQDEQTLEQTFIRAYLPQTRMVIVGAGPYVDALTAIATQAGYEVMIWSPEEELVNRTLGCGVKRSRMSRSTELPVGVFDAWTAAVLLFHEHDWESKVLCSILKTNCFYIGALGSRKTQANRLQQLRALGVDEEALNRIHGPVGVSINARTPHEIAVSILADVIREKNSPDSEGSVEESFQ